MLILLFDIGGDFSFKKSKLKAVGIGLVTIISLASLPTYSSAATLKTFTTSLSTNGIMTGAYSSNGGTYQVCVSDINSGNRVRVQLFESDPNTPLTEIGSDKYISSPSGCATWTGISGDGSDGKAELNAKLNSTAFTDTVTVKLID